MANTPPKFPWIKGVQPGYRSFDIKVSICEDNDGQVFSIHELSPEDEQICSTLNSRGLEQIAFGLLVEAMRRESFLAILLKQSQDESFLERYSSGDEDVRRSMVAELSSEVQQVMGKSIQATTTAACAEVLEMILMGSAETT